MCPIPTHPFGASPRFASLNPVLAGPGEENGREMESCKNILFAYPGYFVASTYVHCQVAIIFSPRRGSCSFSRVSRDAEACESPERKSYDFQSSPKVLRDSYF